MKLSALIADDERTENRQLGVFSSNADLEVAVGLVAECRRTGQGGVGAAIKREGRLAGVADNRRAGICQR